MVKIYLGELFLKQGNYHEAIYYFRKVENLKDIRQSDFKVSSVYHNLGLCYMQLKAYPAAEKYLLNSSRLQQEEKDTVRMVSAYIDLANLYYEQYLDEKAIPYFEKAYHLSKETKNHELKQSAAFNMAVVEENRLNFSMALEYRKEYESWKDSVNNQSKIWSLAKAEKEFAVKAKEKEILLLKTENTLKITQRNFLFLSLVFMLLLFGTGVYFFRQKIKNNKIILLQKQNLDALNASKDKLFSIVSHDLRSSVNTLKTSNKKIFEYRKVDKDSQLDSLLQTNNSITNSVYNLLDNLLNWSLLQTRQLYFNQEYIHLSSVIQQVEYNYKPLMSFKNIVFECAVPDHIFVWADLDSVKIILRNLLDNAIKFSGENGMIKIYSSVENDFCNLVVEDRGIGMKEKTRKELLENTVPGNKKSSGIAGTGLGLQLCKEMIQKNDGVLRIESEENLGTRIIIQLQKTGEPCKI